MKLYRQKRYKEAAEKFTEAVRLRSDAVASVISLGNCYLRLGEKDKALGYLLQATRIDPKYGPAHFNLATYYSVTGHTELALQSLKTAIQVDPRAKSEAKRDPDFDSLKSNTDFQSLVN